MKIDYWKLIFNYNGINYKICSFGKWEKDDTVFFELFSGEGKPMYIPKGRGTQRGKNETGRVFSNGNVDMTDLQDTGFVPHKVSFHPSGIFHSKNKRQEIYEK